MTLLVQILLLVSYGVMALAMAILMPRYGLLTEMQAQMLAFLFFLLLSQISLWLKSSKGDKGAADRLAELEDIARLLRADLERTKRDVERHSQTASNGKQDKLASELRILHTLLDQVMRKKLEQADSQKALEKPKASAKTSGETHQESGIKTVAAPKPFKNQEAGGTTESLSADDNPAKNRDATDLQDAADLGDDEADFNPRERIYNSETEGVTGDRRPSSIPARLRLPVRLIDDEELLLSVIRSSLSENRVDLYLQPTVRLPSRQTMHFECFSRVRDEEGRLLLPRHYLPMASKLGLAGTIDNLLLFRLIQLLRRLGRRQPDMRFFCNLSRSSIEDQEFFPQFVDFMTSNEEFAERLVFELSQEDFEQLNGEAEDRLMMLGRRGFSFCLDHFKDIDRVDRSQLVNRRVRFLKVDWHYLNDAYPREDIQAFAQSLRGRGVQAIAAQLENEEQIIAAIETGFELAQGYMLGEPAPAVHFAKDL